MTAIAIPGGAGRAAGGIAGALGGRVIGGIIGSIFGPLGTVAGQYAGGVAGRYLGGLTGGVLEDYLSSNMETANEKADTTAKAETKADEEPCQDCEPKCRELEKQMNDEMYANKRGPGGGGKHGLANRHAEQICGQYGPGMTKMESLMRGGSRIIRQSVPWDTHAKEIEEMQDRLRKMKKDYDNLNCGKNPKSNLNKNAVKRMTDDSFNPSPSEWLGPSHPSCQGLGDLMRNNISPELPRLPWPGNGNPGVPMS